MNRLGHYNSYHTKEEIETEARFESTKNNLFTPSGMKLDPQCGTGVAWDKFDRSVEAVSGKDTLHDTVGIAYQTVITDLCVSQYVHARVSTYCGQKAAKSI